MGFTSVARHIGNAFIVKGSGVKPGAFVYNISMILFDGKLHAQKLEQDIQTYLATRGGAFGAKPKLAIIQIGKNDSSEKYINLKTALCQRLGLEVVYTPIEDEDTIALAWWPDSDQSEWWIALKELRPVIDINYCKPCRRSNKTSWYFVLKALIWSLA